MKKFTTNSLEPSENDVEQPLVPSKYVEPELEKEIVEVVKEVPMSNFVAVKLCCHDGEVVRVGDSIPLSWSESAIKEFVFLRYIEEK